MVIKNIAYLWPLTFQLHSYTSRINENLMFRLRQLNTFGILDPICPSSGLALTTPPATFFGLG